MKADEDLVFVIGTSLVVHPFAALPSYVPPSIPRVLLNKEVVDEFDGPNDAFVKGDCDESILELCRKLGWDEELWKLHKDIGGVETPLEKKTLVDAASRDEIPSAEDTVTELAKELERDLKLSDTEAAKLKKVENDADPTHQTEPVEIFEQPSQTDDMTADKRTDPDSKI